VLLAGLTTLTDMNNIDLPSPVLAGFHCILSSNNTVIGLTGGSIHTMDQRKMTNITSILDKGLTNIKTL
jgi:hypothetical protein